jgi:hypothetical protein
MPEKPGERDGPSTRLRVVSSHEDTGMLLVQHEHPAAVVQADALERCSAPRKPRSFFDRTLPVRSRWTIRAGSPETYSVLSRRSKMTP